MIKSNLAIIMAEKKIKISELSRKTGISRVTLTSLYYNNSGGIQFDTLNNLCNFLSVKPSDILVYYPFDYKIKDLFPNVDSVEDFEIEYTINNKFFSCPLSLDFSIEKKIEPEDEGGEIIVTEVFLVVSLRDKWELLNNEVETSEESEHFEKFFKNLPSDIKNDIENYIISESLSNIPSYYCVDDDTNINFEWEI